MGGEDDKARALGAHIRKLRKARGMSQRELADRMGWLRPNLSRLENAAQWRHDGTPTLPHLRSMIEVAGALGVPVAEVVSVLDEVTT